MVESSQSCDTGRRSVILTAGPTERSQLLILLVDGSLMSYQVYLNKKTIAISGFHKSCDPFRAAVPFRGQNT